MTSRKVNKVDELRKAVSMNIDADEVDKLLQEGLSIEDICNRLRVSRNTLILQLARLGKQITKRVVDIKPALASAGGDR